MKKTFYWLLMIGILFSGCEKNSGYPPVNQKLKHLKDTSNVYPGIARIKVTDQTAELLNHSTSFTDQVFAGLNIRSVSRVFPEGGKFEDRTRKSGLHLWYTVTFSEELPITKTAVNLSELEGVQWVEYIPRKRPQEESSYTYPFNDPYLPKQWHLYNDGSISSEFVPGADVNVMDVWKYYTTGKEQVIVAIVDTGVDIAHPDLVNNLWINQAEKDGVEGVDDDNNGIIDDLHGANFITQTAFIRAENHGTHVAGIIAATNNNNTGVCGIAGGDGTEPGVRLMICQIMDEYNSIGNEAGAIKYAADNGAVICQNSWGYGDINNIPQVTKEAIDYFIKYAGYDENGNQTGPMAGGLVVFAAGNNNTTASYPAMYEKVLSVASIAPDYKKAYYSNYGNWIGISAPGGDFYYSMGQIYSTIRGGQYGFMQGTSMACPQVSGVAALVVSHAGKQGFTSDELKRILTENASPVIFSHFPQYRGSMGSGVVDAFASIASLSKIAPERVTQVYASVQSNNITLHWIVPEDKDDTKAYGYRVLTATAAGDSLYTSNALTANKEAGETVSLQLTGFDFNTTYRFTVQAYDFAGNYAEPSDVITVLTEKNNDPVIEPMNGTSVTLKAHETKTLEFKISDPDGHTLSVNLDAGSKAATFSLKNDLVTVSIDGKLAQAGDYSGILRVTDPCSGTTQQSFTYKILPNTPPRLLATPNNVYLDRTGAGKTLKLIDYFIDDDDEPLNYSYTFAPEGFASAVISDGFLNITGKKYGMTTMTVTATDALGTSCSCQLLVLTRDGKQQVDLYPNPVTNILNVRTGQETEADIAITSSSGARVYKETVTITPFNPARIDMSAFSGGVYAVTINLKGQIITRNIVKL